MKENATILEILTSLSKQRGFVFQSSEIYGGLGSTWDYGPLGVELKRNIKNLWWKDSYLPVRDLIESGEVQLINIMYEGKDKADK